MDRRRRNTDCPTEWTSCMSRSEAEMQLQVALTQIAVRRSGRANRRTPREQRAWSRFHGLRIRFHAWTSLFTPRQLRCSGHLRRQIVRAARAMPWQCGLLRRLGRGHAGLPGVGYRQDWPTQTAAFVSWKLDRRQDRAHVRAICFADHLGFRRRQSHCAMPVAGLLHVDGWLEVAESCVAQLACRAVPPSRQLELGYRQCRRQRVSI